MWAGNFPSDDSGRPPGTNARDEPNCQGARIRVERTNDAGGVRGDLAQGRPATREPATAQPDEFWGFFPLGDNPIAALQRPLGVAARLVDQSPHSRARARTGGHQSWSSATLPGFTANQIFLSEFVRVAFFRSVSPRERSVDATVRAECLIGSRANSGERGTNQRSWPGAPGVTSVCRAVAWLSESCPL